MVDKQKYIKRYQALHKLDYGEEISDALALIHEQQKGLEPTKKGYSKRKEAAFAASIPRWLASAV